MTYSDIIRNIAWSSCNRFVAVDLFESVEVLDAVTLGRLHTFTHPSSQIGCLSFSPDGRSLTWIDSSYNGSGATWDLQTGGRISVIPPIPNTFWSRFFSSTYSMDGKALAVAGFRASDESLGTVVFIYNLISGTYIYSHRPLEGNIIAPIWTHGEFLRFATVKPGSITIWEVGFTSEHTLVEIESLPAPDDVGYADNHLSRDHLFLPTLSRLAFILDEAVLIWDAQDSKILLNFTGGGRPKGLSFSSDGRFFACDFPDEGAHLWKESPTGYVLHQKLVSGLGSRLITPVLSPDGELIITFDFQEIQLWRTTDPINPPSSLLLQPAEKTKFILAFSPDKSFIATGRLGENIATIVDLKSGDPRLIVDTDMKICSLGVTASTAIVVGDGKIITWNLPAEDCVLDAKANIHDSVRTIVFDYPPPPPETAISALISPDFNHLVIVRGGGTGLNIYDMSTGKHVVGVTVRVSRAWFTRDGREVWDRSDPPKGQRIIRGRRSDIIGLEPVGDDDDPSGGHLWESSHGHKVTDDGWILDSRKKRVIWLPHHWRVYEDDQMWDGRFLALFGRELPEPIIIELDE